MKVKNQKRTAIAFYTAQSKHWAMLNCEVTSETIESAIQRFDDIWFWVNSGECSIDSTRFYPGDQEYFIEGRSEPIEASDLDDSLIALANCEQFRSTICSILDVKCWASVKSYPPAKVLSSLFRESFGMISWARTANHVEAAKSLVIQFEESIRLVKPTVALFLASLVSVELRKPSGIRVYTPTAEELEMARDIVLNEPKILQKSLAKRMKISGQKASETLEILRREGLYSAPKKRPNRKI